MNALLRHLSIATAVSATVIASPAMAQTVRFDVPAQDVASAVREFARQAKVQIVISGDNAAGRRSQAISGTMTVPQALERMLAGTGLTAQLTGADTYVVLAAPKTAVRETGPVAEPPAAAPIFVTAQRREENLQDVPLAISVVSGEEADRRGTTELQEVARTVPGLTVSAFSEAEPIIAIRGASNTFSQAGASKPVGVFIDDVYISRNSASTFQLFDLESIEVLRGPQGTLFGRNVTGGAIVVNTAKPNLTSSIVKGEVGYGNYDAWTLRGLVNGPLGDSVAAKISVNYARRDGFSTDRLIDREADNLDSISVRGAVLFDSGDAFSLLVSADYGRDKNKGRALSATSPANADDGDPRTTETGYPQRYHREAYGLSATATLETGIGTVTSITAYRDSDADEDLDFSPVSYTLLTPVSATFPFQRVTENRDHPRTFSQEVRLVSDGSSPFGYVLGLYYFREDIDRDARTIQFNAGNGGLNRDRTFVQDVTTSSYAAYVDLDYDLADWLTAHLGGRYTYEKKRVDVDFIDALAPGSNFSDADFDGDYDAFTPRVALEAKPTDNLLVYASYTRGFTAGGFNTEEPSIGVISDPFAPETVDAYEAGIKSQLIDRRLTFNLAGFVEKYKNKQEGFLNSNFNFVIRNAGKATIKGVEMETRFAITRNVSVSASYAYLDARYDEFLIDLNNEDRAGNILASSPENSFSLGMDADVPLTDTINLLANASYSWQDDYYTGSENRDTFLIDSYGLANASIGLEDADGAWRVLFWADNIFDKEYVLVRSDFTAGGVGESYGAPSTYGVRVGFRF